MGDPFPGGDLEGVTYSVCFSPDGQLFARASSDQNIRYITVAPTFSTALPFDYPDELGAFDVRFSPDGSILAAGFDDRTAKLFRIPDGAELGTLAGHSRPVTSVDFSPDGTLLATAAADGDARLWRIPDCTHVRTVSGAGSGSLISIGNIALGRARFSADGKMLLSLSNSAIRFWSVADGKLLLTYPDVEAFSLAVSPDAKHFAYGTGARYSTNGAVVLAAIPLLITDISRIGDQLVVGWSGGTGRYRVQSTVNVVNGPWQNVGAPTTATAATNTVSATIFYRVESLPNP